jgi:hypothetical protein
MAAGTWTAINTTRSKILDGTLKTGGTWKVALVTNAGNVSTSSTLYSAVTGEVGTTNTGYSTGGASLTPALSGTTSVTWKGSGNATWTAGSSNLTAKWAVIYETVSSQILGFVTLDSGGADVTTTSSNVLTLDLTTNPVFTLA